MGIKDLPRQLKEDKRFVTEVDPQQLKDKTLGVDAFVWLHRVVSKASNDVDYCRRFHAELQVPFYEQLHEFLNAELRLWRNLHMHVILVVDGKSNPLKASEDQKRQDSRDMQVKALKEFMMKGVSPGHKKLN